MLRARPGRPPPCSGVTSYGHSADCVWAPGPLKGKISHKPLPIPPPPGMGNVYRCDPWRSICVARGSRTGSAVWSLPSARSILLRRPGQLGSRGAGLLQGAGSLVVAAGYRARVRLSLGWAWLEDCSGLGQPDGLLWDSSGSEDGHTLQLGVVTVQSDQRGGSVCLSLSVEGWSLWYSD